MQRRRDPSVLNYHSNAIFSMDRARTYRYWLIRTWVASWDWEKHKAVAFIMLNPSTADAFKNDPTVERCERRARAMKYDGLIVGNIFALRSTDPKALYRHDDPVGPENDEHLLRIASRAARIVCGWGTHGALRDRGARVIELLSNVQSLYCLHQTVDGNPAHPLYLSYDLKPKRMK